MNVNDLSAWLKLADQQNLFGTAYKDSAGMYDPSGQRLQWAARMSQQENKPDFFGAGPAQHGPAYVPPQSVDMNAQRPMPVLRRDYFNNDPMRGGVQNYLAQLLGSRYSGGS
jgi:hypothetical protein